MKIIFKNFRVVDEDQDLDAIVIVEDGIIRKVIPKADYDPVLDGESACLVLDGAAMSGVSSMPDSSGMPHMQDLPAGANMAASQARTAPGSQRKLCLMPAFVDLHAHFRDALDDKLLPAETLESASMAAAKGGYGTVICMANTMPVIDSIERAAAIKKRADRIGIVDLYPVLSITKNLEGRELSEITLLKKDDISRDVQDSPGRYNSGRYYPLMISEDGKDIADDDLFLAAMKEARRLGIPISCHCDFGGEEAEAAKQKGLSRNEYSRIEENNATERAIELGRKAGCHIHIAHVSTKEAIELIKIAKTADGIVEKADGFRLTCEVMPHNLALTEDDAERLGSESWGRVNPPLRKKEDIAALIRALHDGIIDAIATDHAPHSRAAKEGGAAGFSTFETALASAYTELVRGGMADSGMADSGKGDSSGLTMSKLSSLMSARPARLLGLDSGRGKISPGYRADLVIVDLEESRKVDGEDFISRGKNTPYQGLTLFGKILMTLHGGRIVYQL